MIKEMSESVKKGAACDPKGWEGHIYGARHSPIDCSTLEILIALSPIGHGRGI